MPSRNPLPLSASQEAQVREIFYERVRGYCGPEIKGEHMVKLWQTLPLLFSFRKLRTPADPIAPPPGAKQHSQPAPWAGRSRSPLPAASRTG